MALKNFQQIVDKIKSESVEKRIVVAAAEDHHTLEAVFRAAKEGLVKPVLVGNKEKVLKIIREMNVTVSDNDLYDVSEPNEAALKAVELIRENKGDFLMKGKLDTAELLRPVVNRETGLGTSGLMCGFALFEIPSYHKLLGMMDGGMLTYPTLEQKKKMIESSDRAFRKLGYEKINIAVLAAIEKVNPKMPETVEADALSQMSGSDEMPYSTIAGPVSLDVALSKEAAALKGYDSPVAGDADMVLVSNIHMGNVLGKSITILGGGKMAGVILGAKAPVIVSSRSSSAEEKYLSIIVASALSG